MNKAILYVCVNNHFDPIWRRCWDQPFTFQGNTFVSYADLQERYFLENLELIRKHAEYKFQAECALSVRKFLERHPECEEELKMLVRQRRFAVTGAGDNIIDANMVLGESIVRNYVRGLLLVEDKLGQPATRLAVRNDAFGNSAQLPQILRGCEIPWVTGFNYTEIGEEYPYWQGLDGSAIVCQTLPTVARCPNAGEKYAPCPACRGSGWNNDQARVCRVCQGRGIRLSRRPALPDSIDAQKLEEFGTGLVRIAPEEALPNPELIGWVASQREFYDVCFALEEDLGDLPQIRRWLDRVDDPPEEAIYPGQQRDEDLHFKRLPNTRYELNPNNSGCLVTRIKTKQVCRRQEYALLTAEALASVGAMLGRMAYPRAALKEIWQTLLITMTHDALSATHIDPAYRELSQMWRRIDMATEQIRERSLEVLTKGEDNSVSVINPMGFATTQLVSLIVKSTTSSVMVTDENGNPITVLPTRRRGKGEVEVRWVARDVPPLGAAVYRIAPGGNNEYERLRVSADEQGDLNGVDTRHGRTVALGRELSIETGHFRVTADEHGICSVYDKSLGKDVLKGGSYRPGELILEHDRGSPWTTLSSDQRRIRLAPYTHLVGIERGRGWQQLILKTHSLERMSGSAYDTFQARTRVTLLEGIERIDFQTEVDWDTYNHRLRVAMPVPHPGRHFHEIPYGVLERDTYQGWFGPWDAANGDWPATNWAGVHSSQISVALMNKGLPSYRIEREIDETGLERNVILLSVLRSPVEPTYLDEKCYYAMTDWDGMRDKGKHSFSYAVTAYGEPFHQSPIVLDAEAYNMGLVAVAGRAEWPAAAMPRVESHNVRLACVKWAEIGDALILRLCEFRGQGGDVKITFPPHVRALYKVNLLERRGEAIEIENGQARLFLRPWEIATLRLEWPVEPVILLPAEMLGGGVP